MEPALTPHEYRTRVKKWLAKEARISAESFSGLGPQTDRIELESVRYLEAYNSVLGDLRYMLGRYNRPERLDAIIGFFRKRYSRTDLPTGLIAIACLELGCELDFCKQNIDFKELPFHAFAAMVYTPEILEKMPHPDAPKL